VTGVQTWLFRYVRQNVGNPPEAGWTQLQKTSYTPTYLRHPPDPGRGELGVHPIPAWGITRSGSRLIPTGISVPVPTERLLTGWTMRLGATYTQPLTRGGETRMSQGEKEVTEIVPRVYYRQG
jgi:hypothetical protein